MANIYISIVSHGHDYLIKDNLYLHEISKLSNVNVVVKDNIRSDFLKKICEERNYTYLVSMDVMGFGENNNFNFDHCIAYGMGNNDWFLCLNPDVLLDVDNFLILSNLLNVTDEIDIFTVNLFQDNNYQIAEKSLRYFPKWSSLFRMLIGLSVTDAYDKDALDNNSIVDWASGAFLIFPAGLYKQLGGFDKSYFMYYEDVDICYRARKKYGYSVRFFKQVKAVHAGAYQNRKILSVHFRWYLKSLLLFLFRRRKL
ncbi:TPA: glycosyltransferase family 2 protein [Vibrio parahaemolyticus]|nr:glycosyltransferase family 2 protein [Vibrio parahaemolyticus]